MRDIESKLQSKLHAQLDELRMPDRLPSIRQRSRHQRVLSITGVSLLIVAMGAASAWGLNALNRLDREEAVADQMPKPSDMDRFARFNITFSGGLADANGTVEISSRLGRACYDAQIMAATSGHLHRDGLASPVITFNETHKPPVCVGEQDAATLQNIIEKPENYYIEFHNSSSGGTLTALLEPAGQSPSDLPGEILVSAIAKGGSTDSALFSMKPDGTNRTTILEGSWVGHQLERPSWAPDRSKVAFNAYFGDLLNSEILVMNADGTMRKRLTHDSEPVVGPVWSPDGTRVVYARADDGRAWELWVMNADGSDQELLTNASTAGDAAWSPDGRRIVFSQYGVGDSGNQELFVMEISSGTVTRITDTPALESNPAWSPDGSDIAFISEEGSEGSALHAMKVTDLVQTELVSQDVSSVGGLAWSPDGKRIVFVRSDRWTNPPSVQDQDQIAVVRAEGGDPQPIGPALRVVLGLDWR